MFVVVAKTIIALLCTFVVGGLVWYQASILPWLQRQNPRLVLLGAWMMARILPFVVIFIVLDFTPFSDLDGFFNQAKEAVQLKMVYRDFYCMYSPFFPYINGLALWFWLDKKAIILLMILIEGLTLWTTNRFYEPVVEAYERLYRSLIYLFLPGALVLCVFGGQEDEWMWLVLIATYLLWQGTRQVALVGVGLVIGFLLTKAVFILVGPALLLLIPKPLKWLSAAVIFGLLCLGVLYHYTEWEWLEQPLNEAATLRAPNWLSVLNPLTFDVLGAGAKAWNWLGLLLTTGIGALTAYRLRNLDFRLSFSAAFVMIFGTMMVAQQSAYSNYIFIFLLPLTFIWVDFRNRREVIWFLIFNALSIVQPSLWWRLKSPYYRVPSDIWAQPLYLLDYAMQIGVVICTFYFLRMVWQKSLRLV
ncbi:hypothetical protein [Runella zeae]|uniref:hypothetical protein n=1 Tax=Runella zeae TaxID=94255 RepID=UPI00048CFE65|nr:hypothetical protein [Runella zeae]